MKKKKPIPCADWTTRFRGMNFAFVGLMNGLSKQDFITRIEIYGGVVVDGVSEVTNYLVVGQTRGPGPSGAEKKARKLNTKPGVAIQIISDLECVELMRPTRDEAVQLLMSPEGLELWEKIRWWSDTFAVDLSYIKLQFYVISGVNLRNVELAGADLREADLSHSCLPNLQNAQLDGANLREACPVGAVNSSLRKVDMTGGTFYYQGQFEQSDFTNAILKDTKTNGTKFKESSFKNADLTGTQFRSVDVSGCDFTGATLVHAMFPRSNFSHAKLVGAKLNHGDFSEANFQGADLRKADLREANLAQVDFTGAIIEGANFSGALLNGAKLDSLNPEKAKGLDPDQWQHTQTIGPHVAKMLKLATKAGHIYTTAEVLVNHERVEMAFDCYGSHYATFVTLHHTQAASPRRYYQYLAPGKTLQSLWLNEINRFQSGTLVRESIQYKSSKSPVKGKELRALLTAAWCEAFGVEIPSP